MANLHNNSFASTNVSTEARCIEACLDLAPQVEYQATLSGSTARPIMALPGNPTSGNLALHDANSKLPFVLPDGALGSNCGRRLEGRMWQSPIIANYGMNYAFPAVDAPGQAFNMAGGGNGRRRFHIEFDVPVDVRFRPVSLNNSGGFTEFIIIRTQTDEFQQGPGSTLASQFGIVNGSVFSDGNNSGEIFMYRHVTYMEVDIDGHAGFFSGFGLDITKTFPGFVQRQCRVPLVVGCASGDRQTDLMCQQINAAPDWLQSLTSTSDAAWEYSSDSGATWGPVPAVAPAAVVGQPAGLQRWRTAFTIPAGYVGFWRAHVAGLLYTGGAAANFPSYYLDGVLHSDAYNFVFPGTISGGGRREAPTGWIPPDAGPHTLEIRSGSVSALVAGQTNLRPVVTPDYRPIYREKVPFQRHRCNGVDAYFDHLGNPFSPDFSGSTVTVGDCNGLLL